MNMRWTEYHSDPALRIRLEWAETGGRRMHRIAVGPPGAPGSGAVVVARRRDGSVLLVRHRRPAVGRTLWELPRGAAEPGDIDLEATGLRELGEETGLRAVTSRALGRIHPDSGLLDSSVEVVAVTVGDEARATRCDGEVDALRWHSLDEIQALIAEGLLRDAISLAALAVAGER